ncbi:hypothetical protein CC78DRAFT_580996 [Lojkania enalia]|uniref:Uncharacterized protein n=1 Tax=Lojkania enalia TaxID=147567 RepID=A0A9P4N5W2_9PLEO|nr:hypothetical protein CC78DRAFT_580996 [Didymosphaeria enalia]
MPMAWTPRNDQILLVKLIETHGIPINADKIAEAWPSDAAAKPTPRAIKERFVKIRALTSNGASTPSKPPAKLTNATPPSGTIRLSETPKSSSKKRTYSKKDDSESDADGHVTPTSEEETPKTRKFNSGIRAKGNRANGAGAMDSRSPSARYIKNEPLDDPFDSGDFSRQLLRATELHRSMSLNSINNATLIDPYDFRDVGSFGTMDGGNESVFNVLGMNGNNVAGINDISMGFPAPPGLSYATSPMNMSSATTGSGLFSDSQHLNLSPNNRFAYSVASPKPTTGHGLNMPQSATRPGHNSTIPANAPAMRQRTPRKASVHASEEMQAWIKKEKEMDRANGLPESEEDSAESLFRAEESDFEEYV